MKLYIAVIIFMAFSSFNSFNSFIQIPAMTTANEGGGPVIAGTVTTLAGSGISGYQNGTLTVAQFSLPSGITIDSTNANLYVSDVNYNLIRKIDILNRAVTTFAGVATEAAGYFNSTGTAAKFYNPHGITIDSTNSNLYVVDGQNSAIRKIVISTKVVTTLAGFPIADYLDSTGTSARFRFPRGITIDSTNTNLYVADTGNNRIRKIVISTGVVTTFAGPALGYLDDTGNVAQFNSPYGITIDSTDTNLYVSDTDNNKILKIVISTGVVTILAGSTSGLIDGTGTAAKFNRPRGLTIDSTNSNLYVVDFDNYKIRKIVISSAVVTTLVDTANQFIGPTDIIINSTDTKLYVTERFHTIRTIT